MLIQTEAQRAVAVVRDSVERTLEGTEVIEVARQAFALIRGSVADIAEEITVSTGEVAAVAEQSSASVEQVSASAEQTSASSADIASAARELTGTEELEAIVSGVKLAQNA